MTPTKRYRYAWATPWALAFTLSALHGQTVPAATTATDEKTGEETIVLSPFEVSTDQDRGYMATSSLAGTRINTNLSDVGSAISVVTSEFLRDTGATDNRTLLQYTAGTEVGSLQGNFINARSGNQDEGSTFTSPNTNTRVRGLTAADNTRNFFLTDIPWESYATDRVDIQRGPNSILFGMGSPAGIINTSTKTALYKNVNEAEFRYGSYGTTRATLDINRELLDDELAARLIFLRADNEYRQRPAYSLDKRLFSTLRYDPKFLNRDGMTTSLKANAEWGRVRSNNPRVVTPIDYITPWFDQMGKATYDPTTVQDNSPYYRTVNGVLDAYAPANVNQFNRTFASPPSTFVGTNSMPSSNPDYQPWLGNFAQSYGGLLGFFQPGSTTPNSVSLSEFRNIRGVGADGAIDGGVSGLPYSRRVSVKDYSTYAKDVGLPFSGFGLYKNKTLTDPSIFDFYNNLLDGDNKQEWQNFRDLSVSLSQTFMHNLFGYELAYDRQSYGNGQLQLMTDQKAGIYIDINAVNLDGSANPNVGRPFISDSGIYGNNASSSVRDSARFTAFLDYDFNRSRQGNWVRKALGRYLLSGLISRDRYDTDSRSFMRWGTADDYTSYISKTTLNIDDNLRTINPVVYLGDSLSNLSTYRGAHIAAAGNKISIPAQVQMYNFDSTWNGTVNPGATYVNKYGSETTQSENPANYVGWSNKAVNIYSYENGGADAAALTTGATLNRKISKSMAATLQTYFWDGAIVGTYGIRQDHVQSWSKTADRIQDRVDFSTYQLPDDPDTVVTKNSPSWSVVAKLDKLIGGHLPFVDINFFYNKSQNFQVTGTRNDVYGRPLALPNGETVDKGILIATKDGKYSFKVNKFESTVKAASSTAGLNSWFLSSVMTWGSNASDSFQYHLGSTGDPSTVNNSDTWHYVWSPDTSKGETQADADARMNASIAAWHDLQAKIPSAYYSAWHFTGALGGGSNVNDIAGGHSSYAPANLTITEDQISRGYEFEFTANPLPNWRITANAAKVEAIRNNVGGDAMNELVGIINTALNTTAAGDMRMWSGDGAASNTILSAWNGNFYSDYSRTRLSEGNVSPELRKWRFNIVSNYSFERGLLKGTWVGVGYRWQDKIAIGYKPLPTSDPNIITFDLAHPYYGPKEDAVDFWIGYSRKLTEKINWRIQLNVRDAFKGNRLIPLTTQPDGSVAAWRIAPSQTWELSNTFTF